MKKRASFNARTFFFPFCTYSSRAHIPLDSNPHLTVINLTVISWVLNHSATGLWLLIKSYLLQLYPLCVGAYHARNGEGKRIFNFVPIWRQPFSQIVLLKRKWHLLKMRVGAVPELSWQLKNMPHWGEGISAIRWQHWS